MDKPNVETKSVKEKGIVWALTNSKLSIEARAIVAQGFYTGIAQEVSAIIPFNKKVAPYLELLLRQLIIAGWGEELGQYLEVLDVHGNNPAEALRKVQLAVKSGAALFAVASFSTGNEWHCILSIHHGLADEHSLKVLECQLQVAQSAGLDSALASMRRGREFYGDYVRAQTVHSQDDSGLLSAVAQSMVPVRLLQTGRLAFNIQKPRVSLQYTLDIAAINVDKSPIAELLVYLQRAAVIAEGDTLCSSHDWRPTQRQGAVGMMTGLVPLSLAPLQTPLITGQTSLEARALCCPAVRQVLDCCRTSELFINGAASRSIPASQAMSATFPVGIEIRRTRPAQWFLEFEGAFCDIAGATNLINELADVLMNGNEWND